MFMSIAISRVAPVIMPIIREAAGLEPENDLWTDGKGFGTEVGRVVGRLGALAKAADRECKSSFLHDFGQFFNMPFSISYVTHGVTFRATTVQTTHRLHIAEANIRALRGHHGYLDQRDGKYAH